MTKRVKCTLIVEDGWNLWTPNTKYFLGENPRTTIISCEVGIGRGKDIIHSSSKESEHLRLKVKTKLKISSKTQQFFIKDVLNNKTNCKTLSVNQSNYFLLVDLVNACRRAKGLLLLFFLHASHIEYSFFALLKLPLEAQCVQHAT